MSDTVVANNQLAIKIKLENQGLAECEQISMNDTLVKQTEFVVVLKKKQQKLTLRQQTTNLRTASLLSTSVRSICLELQYIMENQRYNMYKTFLSNG